MTTTLDRTTAATGVVQEFFDAYRRHDVDAMVDLCTDNAGFTYVAFESWGKQRVLRGDGRGGFVTAGSYPAGSSPNGVVLAHFNGDSYLDAALTNDGNGRVAILLGQAGGAFGPPATYAMPTANSTPIDLQAADFDGDGDNDVVVALYDHDDLWLLRGRGNGTFDPATPIVVDGLAQALTSPPMYWAGVFTPSRCGRTRSSRLVFRLSIAGLFNRNAGQAQ